MACRPFQFRCHAICDNFKVPYLNDFSSLPVRVSPVRFNQPSYRKDLSNICEYPSGHSTKTLCSCIARNKSLLKLYNAQSFVRRSKACRQTIAASQPGVIVHPLATNEDCPSSDEVFEISSSTDAFSNSSVEESVSNIDTDARQDNIAGEAQVERPRSIVSIEENGNSNNETIVSAIYEPKLGDIVLGLVVESSARGSDLNIGASRLARMQARESRPVDCFNTHQRYFRVTGSEGKNLQVPLGRSMITIEESESAHDLQMRSRLKDATLQKEEVLSVEVIGQTASGRPLVSAFKPGCRIAWERVRQIKEEDEPIEVFIESINNGGAIASIEGLRAFLPISMIADKIGEEGLPDVTSLLRKTVRVKIVDVHMGKETILISQKAALVQDLKDQLAVGSLVEGTVLKDLRYGAIVSIAGHPFRGLLHISHISRKHVAQTKDVFVPGDVIRALVVANADGRIALSTKELESADGLILRDKDKVFREAEMMAEYFRKELEEAAAESDEELVYDKEYVSPSEPLAPQSYANSKFIKIPIDFKD